MRNIWLVSTCIFILQAVALFLYSRVVSDLSIDQAVDVVLVMSIFVTFFSGRSQKDMVCSVALASMFAMFAFRGLHEASVLVEEDMALVIQNVFLILMVFVLAALATVFVSEKSAGDSYFVCFVCALPFGLGTILGVVLIQLRVMVEGSSEQQS